MIKSLVLILALLSTQSSPGPLFIAGGNISDVKIYSRFIETVGPGKVAIVTTASTIPNFNKDFWKKAGLKNFVLVGPKDSFPQNVKAIWFSGGDQTLLERNYVGKKFEADLLKFWRSGGIIGGTSAGTAIMSRIMIRGSEKDEPEIGTGFDLMPNCILDQHFSERKRLPRLQNACELHPGLVGIGVDENTAIVYDKGVMEIIGHAGVTVVFEGRSITLETGKRYYYPFREKNANNNSRQSASITKK